MRPVDLLAAIRYLRYTKAKVSPRALRYEFPPGEEAQIVLEPFEQAFTLRGTEHNYDELRTIRTWGRRRLKLLEPLRGRSSADAHRRKPAGCLAGFGGKGWRLFVQILC